MSCTRITAFPSGSIALLLFCTLSLFGSNQAAAAPGARYYPNVPLINQDGQTLHFYDDVIKGKVVTINFIFTSCGNSCPLETAKLREVQKMLGEHAGKNVFMYSITVDPDRDTPEVLKTYMKKFNVGPGWQFLTGKKKDIDLIRKKLAMYSEDEQELSDHAINFIIGNETTGQWLKRTPFDVPQSLVAALLGRLQPRSLLASAAKPDYASAPKIAPPRTGEDLFVTRCTACHTIGQGEKMGPDLLGVVSNRERAWLVRWLMEPDAMLQENDPLATALYKQYNNVPMPNLRLSERDALDLIDYMQSESRRVSTAAGAATTATR
jgi:protein SCO1/2